MGGSEGVTQSAMVRSSGYAFFLENWCVHGINHLDALILFTHKVSHNAKKEVRDIAKGEQIPILIHHSSGVYTSRNGSDFLMNRQKR